MAIDHSDYTIGQSNGFSRAAAELHHIDQLKRAALFLFDRIGRWQTISGDHAIWTARMGSLRMAYRSPMQKEHGSFSLEIDWPANVFKVEWTRRKPQPTIINFVSGDWTTELLAHEMVLRCSAP